MATKMNNLILINAPAGSGKTTLIKDMLNEHSLLNPNDNILCITYTNRAADELLKDNKSGKIHISTIHSFISKILSPYFSFQESIDLYMDIFKGKIIERIKDIDGKNTKLNDIYREKNGNLYLFKIMKKTKKIRYNELKFDTVYYGGLSHDSLLSYAKAFSDKYPVINKHISEKYQIIFIDEFQDTTYEILKLFTNAVKNTKSKLYLFGDEMQQIYNRADKRYLQLLKNFTKQNELNYNRRSSATITNLLNKIYNNPDSNQSPPDNCQYKNHIPRVIFSCNTDNTIEKFDKGEYLILYLVNKERFKKIGVIDIFNAYSHMQEKYGMHKNYDVTNILTTPYFDNPDILMRFIFLSLYLKESLDNKNYGSIFNLVKKNKSHFNLSQWTITSHSDKKDLSNNLEFIYHPDFYNKTALDLIDKFMKKSLITEKTYEMIINDDDYNVALNLSMSMYNKLYQYIETPSISTQHGVKGESHNNVIFVADNSTTLNVNMYSFFALWSKCDLNLNILNEFHNSYYDSILSIENSIGIKIPSMKSSDLNNHSGKFSALRKKHQKKYATNNIFKFLYENLYDKLEKKNNLKNTQDCFKHTRILNIINAYKLFYVGCSRAREKLIIILDRDSCLKDSGCIESQKEKFMALGFEVIDEENEE